MIVIAEVLFIYLLSKCIKDGNGKKEYMALPDAKSWYDIVMDHIYESRCFSEIIMGNNPSRVHLMLISHITIKMGRALIRVDPFCYSSNS